jgi:hypothetical protein
LFAVAFTEVSALLFLSQESTHHVSSKAGDVNRMVIPAALPKPKNAFRTTEEEDEEVEGGGGGSGAAGGKKGVMFRLLSRDSKGRFETRALQVWECIVIVHICFLALPLGIDLALIGHDWERC